MGCDCPVCRSTDSRNKRTRASVLISEGDTNLLIDTATEFRLQAISAGLTHLEGIFFTHAHADHTHGLDDIRSLTRKQPIDIYADGATSDELLHRFSYIFRVGPHAGSIPKLKMNRLSSDAVRIGPLEVLPVPVLHGRMQINGYRIGPFAYLTDCSFIPPESYPLLRGLDVLIIDALRYKSHPTHFNVDEALEVIERLAPREALLTHMCHDIDYMELAATLPRGVQPAWDGMEIALTA